jgi:hypothetical protein
MMTWTTSPQDRYDDAERIKREIRQGMRDDEQNTPHTVNCDCRKCETR